MKKKYILAAVFGGIIGGLAGSKCLPVLRNYLDIARTQKAIDDFPTSIPGARDVKKYKISGSRYCLVHIRNRHPLPTQNLEEYLEQLDNPDEITLATQKDIFRLLSVRTLSQYAPL